MSAAWEVYVDECKTGHEKYCPHVKIESNPEYKVPPYEEPENAEALLQAAWRDDGTEVVEEAPDSSAGSSSNSSASDQSSEAEADEDEGDLGEGDSDSDKSSEAVAGEGEDNAGEDGPGSDQCSEAEAGEGEMPVAVPVAVPVVVPVTGPVVSAAGMRDWMERARRKGHSVEAALEMSFWVCQGRGVWMGVPV